MQGQYQMQPQPIGQYQPQSQPAAQYQSPSSQSSMAQYPAPPQWQTSAQPQQPLAVLPPPPPPETGRVHAMTREDAQRADGSVFRG
ncbi:TM2 domain-containing protein DDB_G0277895-like [Zingiber officinale]|uniref:TM2 domain-containing protein DDB_G0277895-like n=1 Tax=Zingiber officinale TaxID=94328 RepID=UPI001C4B0C72|nr:TM2 domain-containing protein DDB_G0277895-like [Zingiber officinale]